MPSQASSPFESLADAARASFPTESCRLIALREHGDVGYGLFDTGPIGQPYLYGVNYERRDGKWSEGSSGNGPGWSQVGPVNGLGTWTVWDEAPPGANGVRLEFDGEVREEPVTTGFYLAAWWGAPCKDDISPRVTAFRINGEWVPVPDRRESMEQVAKRFRPKAAGQ